MNKQLHKEFNHIYIYVNIAQESLTYQGLGLYHLPDGEAKPELAEGESRHALQPKWQIGHIEVCSFLNSPLRTLGA